MAKLARRARMRKHARRFRPVFCVKWTESGYAHRRRFDGFWPSLAFWWKLKYLEFDNLKWEIE